jgi:hypothetical protein
MVAAITLASLLAYQKLETKLIDIEPVTAYGTKFSLKSPFSIGGIVVQNGFGTQPNTDGNRSTATFVYAISDKATALRGVFGIPDGERSRGAEGIFSVYVDGELIKEYRVESEQKPVKVDLALSKATSLKLVFEGAGAFANATLSALGKQEVPKVDTPKTNPPKQTDPPKAQGDAKPAASANRVMVTSPENGEVFKNKAVFKWDKFEEATAYGVEIIMIRNSDPKVIPTRLLRAFTAKGESFEWNFSDDVASGEYQVSVIAFSKKGVISIFSQPKRFKIERK